MVKQDADSAARLLGSPGADFEETIDHVDASFEESSVDLKSPSPSRTARLRSASPTRSRSPAMQDNALAVVQSSVHKRNLQVQELKSKMEAAREEATVTKKQLDDTANAKRQLEKALASARDEIDAT